MNRFCRFCFLSTILLFAACAPDTPLGKPFWDANKMVIDINDRKDGTSVHYETNDVETIKDFHDYIDQSKVDDADNCEHEGKLTLYFTETKTQMFDFSIKRGCQQIVYTMDGVAYRQPLTKKGVRYLESLVERSKQPN